MHFDFMTPALWDGLVIGTVLIGTSLAILRLLSDRSVYDRHKRAETKASTHAKRSESSQSPTKRSRR